MFKKANYRLSPEGMSDLMKALGKVAQGDVDDSQFQIPITIDFVKKMTKVKGVEDVIERDEQLSKTYQGFLNLYGFDTIYDMYIYAMACEPIPEGLLKSDYPRLIESVTKTIIRNGKPMEVMLFFEMAEEIEKADKKAKAKPKKEEVEIPHARQFNSQIISGKELKDPEKLAKLTASARKLKQGDKDFSDTSHHYLVLKGNGSRTVGIVGYTEGKKYVKMDFFRHNGKVSGVGTRGFFEMLQFAKSKKKGVQVEDSKGGRQHYIQAGMTKKGDQWVITYDELKQAYGEN